MELDRLQDGDHKIELLVVDGRTVQNDSDSDEDTTQISMEGGVDDHVIQLPVIHTFLRSFGDIRSISLVSNFQEVSA